MSAKCITWSTLEIMSSAMYGINKSKLKKLVSIGTSSIINQTILQLVTFPIN